MGIVEMRNSYKILENPRGRGQLSDIGLVGRIILKGIIKYTECISMD